MIAGTADFISPWIWGSLGLIIAIGFILAAFLLGLILVLRYVFKTGMTK